MRLVSALAFSLVAGTAGLALAQGMGALQQQLTGGQGGGDVCAGRSTCRVTQQLDAGRDASGRRMTVVEVRLGLSEAVNPDASTDFPCRDDQGSPDGGSEWYLLLDGKIERHILTLCNDGYGASGVGEDTVAVTANHLQHKQYGGSSWRWIETRDFRLSPFALLTVDQCSEHNVDGDSGTSVVIDVATATARVASYGGSLPDGSDVMLGCPKPGEREVEGIRVVNSLAVPVPVMGGEVRDQDGIGTCGLRIAGDGSAGDVFFGAAARPGEGAEVRAVTFDSKSLMLQVRDPKAETGGQGAKSWVGQPHVELYVANTDTSDSRRYAQIGITLDGRVHKGVGAPPTVKVRAWRNVDEANRDVTRLRVDFPGDYPFDGGLVVVYSEAEGGKQLRLTSSSPIEKLQPVNAPSPAGVPSVCTVEGGLLNVTGSTATAEGGE